MVSASLRLTLSSSLVLQSRRSCAYLHVGSADPEALAQGQKDIEED